MRTYPRTFVAGVCVLAAGLYPAISGLAADGKAEAYVSNQQGGVTVIDLDALAPVATIDIQAQEPRGIGITRDGKFLLTANKDSGNISVIDTATLEVTKHIAIGKNPEFIRVYGNRAYVSYEPSAGEGKPEAEEGGKSGEKEKKLPVMLFCARGS